MTGNWIDYAELAVFFRDKYDITMSHPAFNMLVDRGLIEKRIANDRWQCKIASYATLVLLIDVIVEWNAKERLRS